MRRLKKVRGADAGGCLQHVTGKEAHTDCVYVGVGALCVVIQVGEDLKGRVPNSGMLVSEEWLERGR